MVLTTLSFLARVGVIAASTIVLGLNGVFIADRSWLTGVLVYIEVVTAISIGALRILGVIFGVSERMSSGNNYVGANLARLENEPDLEDEVKKERNAKRVKFGLPETTHDLPVVLTTLAEDSSIRILQDTSQSTISSFSNGLLSPNPNILELGADVPGTIGLDLFMLYLRSGSIFWLGTIEFEVTSNVTVPDKFKISLRPATISFFQNGPDPGTSPFATVDLPETTWYSNEKIGVVNQTLQLKNLTEFAKLIQQVAYFPTFRVSGSARAKVHIGSISTWVNLYKVVELTAFNNFTGFDVRQIGIQKPDADGNDVYGEVVVYNPSPASVTLGDVTLDVLIGDVVVGQATTTVNNIVPGNNTFEIKGKINSTAVLNDTLTLVQTEIPFLEQELVVASARGLSVVYDGQHLPYWEEAFQLLRITVTKPVIPLLNALVNSTADELLGDDQFVSPALNFLVDLLVRLLKSIPPQEEAGFEQVVSEIAAILVEILQGWGLV
ncbi:Protein of unknown function DUF3712 [Penicillium occitanis (nom. inval.)]|nr:Protein of unknown function DUF3712 [Penicillium occitanis (nom. inval.)]PCG88990.1 hypothetical protein PENOC_108550 [Penicillium occitanis (nom. inval.)]